MKKKAKKRTKTPLIIKRRRLVIEYVKGEDGLSVTYRGHYQEMAHERPAGVRKAMRMLDKMSFAEIREFLDLSDYLDWPLAKVSL